MNILISAIRVGVSGKAGKNQSTAFHVLKQKNMKERNNSIVM